MLILSVFNCAMNNLNISSDYLHSIFYKPVFSFSYRIRSSFFSCFSKEKFQFGECVWQARVS